jgi:peptidoglycan/LPS O-acetylase OafA/YrhL
VTSASRQTRFLESRAFQFLGQISYSFYLWHALVMSLVKRPVLALVVPRFGVAWGFALFCALSSSLSIAIAWASWSVFEVRLARFAHRFWNARRSAKEVLVSDAHGGELQRPSRLAAQRQP